MRLALARAIGGQQPRRPHDVFLGREEDLFERRRGGDRRVERADDPHGSV